MIVLWFQNVSNKLSLAHLVKQNILLMLQRDMQWQRYCGCAHPIQLSLACYMSLEITAASLQVQYCVDSETLPKTPAMNWDQVPQQDRRDTWSTSLMKHSISIAFCSDVHCNRQTHHQMMHMTPWFPILHSHWVTAWVVWKPKHISLSDLANIASKKLGKKSFNDDAIRMPVSLSIIRMKNDSLTCLSLHSRDLVCVVTTNQIGLNIIQFMIKIQMEYLNLPLCSDP